MAQAGRRSGFWGEAIRISNGRGAMKVCSFLGPDGEAVSQIERPAGGTVSAGEPRGLVEGPASLRRAPGGREGVAGSCLPGSAPRASGRNRKRAKVENKAVVS